MRRDYYRGPDVLVTDECIEVWDPVPHRFQVGELDAVRVVRHRLDRTVTLSAQAAGGALVLVGLSWPSLTSAGSWLIAVMLITAPCVASGICLRLRPRAQELRAMYRNRDVSLYVSADARAFGQIRRALTRAREGVLK